MPSGCVAFGYGDVSDVAGPVAADPRVSVRSGAEDGGRVSASDADAKLPQTDAMPDTGDGGTVDDGGAEAGHGGDAGPKLPALLNLPSDGELASACYAPDECNGDDLLCFGSIDTAPGLCVEDCQDDSDCAEVDGLPARCTRGQCLVNCAGPERMGGGPCPAKMECRQQLTEEVPGVLTPVVVALTDPNFWCVYPVDAGTNDVALLGACDPGHGDGDCAGVRVCHDPDRGAGPGFCTDACEASQDCAVPRGVVASTAVCAAGACELDCSAAGATCPTGMNCRDADSNPLTETFRCVYIE